MKSPLYPTHPPSPHLPLLHLSWPFIILFTCVALASLPLCLSQDAQYSIPEEQQSATFVGNVARDINLEAQLPSAVFSKLHYSILAGSSSHGDLFTVNQDTSDLFTARRLDREMLCRFSLQCQLDFKVGAVSGTYFKNIRVRVLLNDINDNAPRFNRTSFVLDVPESVTVGASFSLDGAVDDDTGLNNSVQTYTLSPSGGPFEVAFTQKLDRTSDVTLIIKEQLDRETRGFYSLKLVASDGGVPQRTAEMAVAVTVLDDNDNAPEFSQPSYSVTIGENVKPGENILTLSARDEDEGINSEIRYRLSAHQDSSVATLFSVDDSSGEITLKQLPASGSYSVIVQAVDGGSPPKETQVVVEVKVIDTTNNPPSIVVTLLNAAVPEDTSVRTPVAHVSVEDPDSGNNGQVICFSQSAYFVLRSLEESDKMVDLARTLDREDSPSYTVTLFCHDNGSPRLNATVTFDVNVDDVNDNPPVFDSSDVTFGLAEGDRVGEIVYTVTATDADLGQNADITYKMLNASMDDAFYVLDATGSIVVAREIDREKRDQYVFQVQAMDGGVPSLSATVTLTVNIEDVNDEAPTFTQDSYEFSIKENAPVGTFVCTFNATDRDLNKGGQVLFSLRSPQSFAGSGFMLSPNGTLVTRRRLDREASSELLLSVVARDLGSPSLSSVKTVRVTLEDVNDNRPVFAFPGPSNHSLTIFIPISADTHLFTLSVTDPDEGQNSVLSYSLLSTNLSTLFSIDTWTGLVTANTDFGDQHLGLHNITFKATDSGAPPLSSVSSLLLTVKLNPNFSPVSSDDDNAVVAISIVCATVFIAIIIVIVVFLLKRRDKGSDVKYMHKVTNNNNNNNSEKGDASATDAYIERQNTPTMFFTTSSSNNHGDTTSTSPILSVGYPHESGQFQRKWSSEYGANSPHWDPDPVHLEMEEKEEVDGGDLQILNRVTSLRLQQAFEHISSIKSQLITASDTGKPYEWREIHVPGRPEDFNTNSLSSRATTVNGDSGLGTDEDGVFLHNPPHPSPHPQHNTPQPSTHPVNHPSNLLHPSAHSANHHHNPSHTLNHQHRPLHSHPSYHHPPRKLGSTTRSYSQPASDNSHDRSQPESCSSLPNLYLKSGSDILVFRPTSATSCESSPSMDDNCTTTSGSYSITFEDSPVGRGGCGDGRYLGKDFRHVQDVYV